MIGDGFVIEREEMRQQLLLQRSAPLRISVAAQADDVFRMLHLRATTLP